MVWSTRQVPDGGDCVHTGFYDETSGVRCPYSVVFGI